MSKELNTGGRSSKIMHGSELEEGQERTYGSWIVVKRRKNVQTIQRSGGTHVVMDNGKLRQEQRKAESEARFKFKASKQNVVDGPSQEAKEDVPTNAVKPSPSSKRNSQY